MRAARRNHMDDNPPQPEPPAGLVKTCQFSYQDGTRPVDVDTGMPCVRGFTTHKGLKNHENSHATRMCKWCCQEFAVNGHTQHERACPAADDPDRPSSIPALEYMLSEFIHHMVEVPSSRDSLLVVNPEIGAVFMRRSAACDVLAGLKGFTLVADPAELERPDVAARWRRRDSTPDLDDVLSTVSPDTEVVPRPAPPAPPVDEWTFPAFGKVAV